MFEFQTSGVFRDLGLFYVERVAHRMRGYVIMIMWRLQNRIEKSFSYSNKVLYYVEVPSFKMSSIKPVWRKTPFPWRISEDGRPNYRTKAAFSNFSCTVWTGLKISMQNAWELRCCPRRRLTWASLLHTLFQGLSASLHDTELVWFNYVICRLKRELERRGGGGGTGSKKDRKRRQRENGEDYPKTFSFVVSHNIPQSIYIFFCPASVKLESNFMRQKNDWKYSLYWLMRLASYFSWQ